jgi:3-oxoacyl-(acyl-carrier-protein) synthase
MPAGLKDVVIAGQGLLSAYGAGVARCADGLFSGRRALRPAGGGFPPELAGMPTGELLGTPTQSAEPLLERLIELFVDAPPLPADTVLYAATTVGEIGLLEQEVIAAQPPSDASRLSLLPRKLAQALGLNASSARMVSSACASSSAALALAASAIRRGACDCALVVGCDLVSAFTLSGFAALMALDPAGARPFDANRRGITLGSAVAVALLMRRERALRERRPCLGVVGGWGMTCDANHLTGPSRDGAPLAEAVRQALRMAACPPETVAAIAAHGTGTVYNDQMELLAFKRVFGGAARPLFSVKGGIGHTLGAAGLAGALLGLEALRRGWIPPTVGLEQVFDAARGWASTAAAPVPSDGAVLATASGFGGVNAALVLSLATAPFPLTAPEPTEAPGIAGSGACSAGETPPLVLNAGVILPRHFGRFSAEAQRAFLAVTQALIASGCHPGTAGPPRRADGNELRIGVMAHDRDGSTAANRTYFSDYVASGCKLGRGQLFAATLPTSAAAECAIALRLRGPLLAVAEPDGGDGAARLAASGLLAEGLADAMVLLTAARARAEARVLTPGGRPLSTEPRALPDVTVTTHPPS